MAKKPVKYILVVEFVPASALEKYRSYIKQLNKRNFYKTELVLLHDRNFLTKTHKERLKQYDQAVYVDFNDDSAIQKALLPFEGMISAVVCRSESYIPKFANVVPHVPYANLPTKQSLLWAVNKLQMRRRFRAHNPKITPKFREVKSYSDEEIDKIEKSLQYPMIVKPFGLAQSLLVTNVYHRDELKKALKRSFKQLNEIYIETEKVGQQGLLVEELMEGSQYSIDCFVNSKGKIYFCPPVHIKTGKQIGFDDYFGYRQMVPPKLKRETVEDAQVVVREAVHALGLRSSTVHVELMRTESGWKVIEVGPRVGGFRDDLYQFSFGIDYSINDLKIRMGQKPEIPKKLQGYAAAMKIYAKEEGEVTSVRGLKSIEKLDSFVKFDGKPKKAGYNAKFAKNGGSAIARIILFNPERSKLLADIRRIENTLKIKVK